MMVAQPRSSLRFSVRREDLSRSRPHPSSTSDTCSTRTTSNDSPRQQPNDLKNNTNSSSQGKTSNNKSETRTRQLPERRAKPQLRQSPLSQQSQAPSLPPSGHERPLKKAKLDGSHEPNAASVAKLPLRSRDSPDLRNGNGTIKTTATRTRTRATSGSLSSPLVEVTSTRSRHNKTASQNLPVAEDEDTEKQRSRSPSPKNNADTSGKKSREGLTLEVGNGKGHRATDAGAKNVEDPAGRRSLRSHDGGSRSKSELAMYFQNYEQMISLEPKKPGILLSFLPQLLYFLFPPLPLYRLLSSDHSHPYAAKITCPG